MFFISLKASRIKISAVVVIAIFLGTISCDNTEKPKPTPEKKELKFPEDYFGTYAGTLNVHNDKGIQEYPMQFVLQATDNSGVYDYKLIYGEGESYQERKYTMIEKDSEKGTYVVDENNGIVLDDKLVGNKLYSLFEVQGNLLTTFITFKEDHLIFEIVFADTKQKNSTFSEGENPIEVTSYPIAVVQQAVLKKQN